MDLFELMKGGVALFAGLMAYTQIGQARLLHKRGMPGMWIHLFAGVLGIYWCLYYLRSWSNLFEPFNMHQVYIRGPLMLTLAVYAAAGAYAMRRLK